MQKGYYQKVEMDATSTCPFLSFFGMSLSVFLAHMAGNVLLVLLVVLFRIYMLWAKRPFGVGELTSQSGRNNFGGNNLLVWAN